MSRLLFRRFLPAVRHVETSAPEMDGRRGDELLGFPAARGTAGGAARAEGYCGLEDVSAAGALEIEAGHESILSRSDRFPVEPSQSSDGESDSAHDDRRIHEMRGQDFPECVGQAELWGRSEDGGVFHEIRRRSGGWRRSSSACLS